MLEKAWWLFGLWVSVGACGPALRADDPKVDGAAPWVLLAQASENKGAVTVVLWHAVPPAKDVVRAVEQGGKKVAKQVTITEVEFQQYEVTFDGKEVRAATAGGKPVAAGDLLTRLRTPTPVAVVTFAKADPAHLTVFREDTIVFTIPALEKSACSPAGERSR